VSKSTLVALVDCVRDFMGYFALRYHQPLNQCVIVIERTHHDYIWHDLCSEIAFFLRIHATTRIHVVYVRNSQPATSNASCRIARTRRANSLALAQTLTSKFLLHSFCQSIIEVRMNSSVFAIRNASAKGNATAENRRSRAADYYCTTVLIK